MARRAKSASAIADQRTAAAPARAQQIEVLQLAGITEEIVTSWRLWRARFRRDAVEILLDSLITFEGVVNSNSLTLDAWRRGGLLNYRGSRVVGVAVCSVVEVYFEILEKLQLTAIVGGDSIVEGAIDAERLRGVEASIDSLSRLAEIVRVAPAVSDEPPGEMQSVEPVVSSDQYADLQQFAEVELRGQEREFLLMVIEAMRQEPNVGLRFATLAQRYRHPNFDCVEYSKNKLGKLRSKINQSGLKYRLRQQDNAAIVECFFKEMIGVQKEPQLGFKVNPDIFNFIV